MSGKTGRVLEELGKTVFTKIGLNCFNPLNHVQLTEVDPTGPYSAGEHFEFDYLIPVPVAQTCLVGEITGLKNPSDIERKYKRFKRNFSILLKQNPDARIWRLLGIPEESLRGFAEVRAFKAFFITTKLQRYDVDLPDSNIARFFKADWELLAGYSESIDQYARYHFLDLFGSANTEPRRPLQVSAMRTTDRKVVGGNIGTADLYTFEASPYELLPMAKVFRRDALPALSSKEGETYQRPLIAAKLKKIRENVLVDADFMFPNSILVVLSNDCNFDRTTEKLLIPDVYGAISVIDGQHRLFSYANDSVRARLGEVSKIIVTAIQFRGASEDDVLTYSARTFIEINTNQTRVSSAHLDAIAYPILHDKGARSLAAQILLKANESRGALFGLFDTNQTSLGIIQTTTVVTHLKSLTNLDSIRGLQGVSKGARLKKKTGYENLFGVTINELEDAETLITRGTACFQRYFNHVRDTFTYDWPKRGETNASSMKYAKMIAGFIKLLSQFVSEGADWNGLRSELEGIRSNVMKLRRMKRYRNTLFDPERPQIPDARNPAGDHFKFLNANRQSPTSIQDLIKSKRKG